MPSNCAHIFSMRKVKERCFCYFSLNTILYPCLSSQYRFFKYSWFINFLPSVLLNLTFWLYNCCRSRRFQPVNKWHPIPVCDIIPDSTFLLNLTFPQILVSIEHLQRVWHADRGRLLLETPDPVPLWDLHVFLCCDKSILNLSCFRTIEFGRSLGTSITLQVVWSLSLILIICYICPQSLCNQTFVISLWCCLDFGIYSVEKGVCIK